jgi:hypothetical protein
MNSTLSTLDGVEFLRESKMYHLALKYYKSRLLRYILRILYPRVSLCFTLSATANTVHALVLRACKYIFKSETRGLTAFRSVFKLGFL